MTDARPSPDELARAREELGLGPDADDAALRRAFRELARAHHPDRGGDPARFDRVRRAFALLTSAGGPVGVRVGTGRPSRPAPQASAREGRVAPRPLDAPARAELRRGLRPLDAGLVSAWLLDPDGGIATLRATSRAPGSRTNRFAHALAEGSTSRLEVRAMHVDRTHVLRTELIALPRRARHALDALRLEGAERGRGWVRTRGSSVTRLHQDHDLRGVPSQAVLDAVEGLTALLDRLAWPLAQWRAIP